MWTIICNTPIQKKFHILTHFQEVVDFSDFLGVGGGMRVGLGSVTSAPRSKEPQHCYHGHTQGHQILCMEREIEKSIRALAPLRVPNTL